MECRTLTNEELDALFTVIIVTVFLAIAIVAMVVYAVNDLNKYKSKETDYGKDRQEK